ncbi:ABC transporter [Azoarcus sp. DD4]|uniref:methionine ABC transporter ATP-binding protein n=1 Tax=Azoarcus sp. DD4 TaxID=2027405 RepID=UPI001126A89F|nr:methionine ABC transporter ATP-binding protein [Azoarcus sp. DD4]QDF98139.1 ABC transporter [Azoarcus sp. DD4]
MTAPASSSSAAIQLRGVTRRFRDADGNEVGVEATDLDVAPGEIHGIIGFSGAGKSTLLRLVNLLERPDAGQVIVHGEDLTTLSPDGLRTARRRIGMIFQHFNLLHNRTVADNVAFPLRIAGESPARIRERVEACLAFVGLSDKAGAYPAQLSGGQKQRVAIARALAPEPHVLLADEPTSALDPRTTLQLLDVLADVNRRFGVTILMVSHEMSVIRRLCHRVSVMERGRVIERVAIDKGHIPAGSRLAQWLAEFGDMEGGAGNGTPDPTAHDALQRESSHV